MSKPRKSKKATIVIKKPTNNRKALALRGRKPQGRNAIHKKLIKMMSRPSGATLHDTWNAGYRFPAMSALKIVERYGYRTNIIKKEGELARYYARKR